MLLLLMIAAVSCVGAFDMSQAYYGTKGGHNTAVDHNKGIYNNMNHASGALTIEEVERLRQTGVCFIEVPTKSLSSDPSLHLKGNGSSPDMSRIRSCCRGFTRNIHNPLLCDPVCTMPCFNGNCVAPETCSCYPDHVMNSTGVCVSTCPIGCRNGQCYGNMCRCNDGYTLDINRKYCMPICSDNCGGSGFGICLAPNTCSCKPGYAPTPTKSCRPGNYNPLQNNLFNQNPQSNQGNYNPLQNNLYNQHPQPNQGNYNPLQNNLYNQHPQPNSGNYSNIYPNLHNAGQITSNPYNQNHGQLPNSYNLNQGQTPNSYNQNQGSNNYNQNGQQYHSQSYNQSASQHSSYSNQSSYNQLSQTNSHQLSSQPGNHNNPGQSQYPTTLLPGQTSQYPGQSVHYPASKYPEPTTPHNQPSQYPGLAPYPGQSNPTYQQNYTSPSLNPYNQVQPGQNSPTIQTHYPNPNPNPWEMIQGYGGESQEPQCSQPCINGVCVQGNRCSCNSGYELDSADPSGTRCRPRCAGGCENGVCSAPNFCICNMGYRKEQGVKGAAARCVRRMKRSTQ